MIERCPLCGKQHETGEFSFGGVPYKICPSVPENFVVPMQKVPLAIHGPNGEVFQFYKYVIGGMPRHT